MFQSANPLQSQFRRTLKKKLNFLQFNSKFFGGKKPDELGIDVFEPEAVFGDGFEHFRRTFAQVDALDLRQFGSGAFQIGPRLVGRGDEQHLAHVQVLRTGPSQVAAEQRPIVDP